MPSAEASTARASEQSSPESAEVSQLSEISGAPSASPAADDSESRAAAEGPPAGKALMGSSTDGSGSPSGLEKTDAVEKGRSGSVRSKRASSGPAGASKASSKPAAGRGPAASRKAASKKGGAAAPRPRKNSQTDSKKQAQPGSKKPRSSGSTTSTSSADTAPLPEKPVSKKLAPKKSVAKKASKKPVSKKAAERPVSEKPVSKKLAPKKSVAKTTTKKKSPKKPVSRKAPKKKTPKRPIFKVGDKVVHPHHGAAVITEVIEQDAAGEKRRYFVLQVAIEQLKVLMPVDTIDQSGIRSVISKTAANEVLRMIKNEDPQDSGSNWSRWYKVLNEKMTSGDIRQVAEVIRDLTHAQHTKGISPALKRMTSRARSTLTSELAYVFQEDTEDAAGRLERALQQMLKRTEVLVDT